VAKLVAAPLMTPALFFFMFLVLTLPVLFFMAKFFVAALVMVAAFLPMLILILIMMPWRTPVLITGGRPPVIPLIRLSLRREAPQPDKSDSHHQAHLGIPFRQDRRLITSHRIDYFRHFLFHPFFPMSATSPDRLINRQSNA
jgi:energy-coupling factor transporter transmembrane protein EcfT